MTMLGGLKTDATGRATGQRKTNRSTKIPGQFVWRLVEMQECPAYRALSLSAHRVLSRVEVELGHHAGKDNGRLPVTFADFVEYGIDRDAIAPAIRESAALGFLEVTEPGRAGNAEFRSPNKFRLTYRSTRSEGATDEWRSIATMGEALSIARAARITPARGSLSVRRRLPALKAIA